MGAPSVIFSAGIAASLKDIFSFKRSGIRIITGDSDDPTSVAKTAVIGSLYIRSGTSEIYKKLDGGSSTNWQQIARPTINSVSSDITLADNVIHLVDTSSVRSLTLPTPTAGAQIVVKDSIGSANANNITIVRAAAEDIDTVAASLVMDSDLESVTLISDGTDWFLI